MTSGHTWVILKPLGCLIGITPKRHSLKDVKGKICTPTERASSHRGLTQLELPELSGELVKGVRECEVVESPGHVELNSCPW